MVANSRVVTGLTTTLFSVLLVTTICAGWMSGMNGPSMFPCFWKAW